MSTPHNPYMKQAPTNVSTADEDNASMQESSPSSKGLGFEETKNEAVDADEDKHSQKSMQAEEEEIDFKENPFQIPPLFN